MPHGGQCSTFLVNIGHLSENYLQIKNTDFYTGELLSGISTLCMLNLTNLYSLKTQILENVIFWLCKIFGIISMSLQNLHRKTDFAALIRGTNVLGHENIFKIQEIKYFEGEQFVRNFGKTWSANERDNWKIQDKLNSKILLKIMRIVALSLFGRSVLIDAGFDHFRFENAIAENARKYCLE